MWQEGLLITNSSTTVQDDRETSYLMPRINTPCLIIQTKRAPGLIGAGLTYVHATRKKKSTMYFKL